MYNIEQRYKKAVATLSNISWEINIQKSSCNL